MSSNPFLALFASTAALVAPEMQDRFEANLNSAFASEAGRKLLEESAASASADDGFWFAADDWRSAYRPYVVCDGILQIPVKGVLLHDFPWALGGWLTGYEYIWRAFERGMADGNVRGIALVIDSPGGMVAGCFEATDKMVALKQAVGKPVRAYAHESAYSAAYAVATVADSITVSRTGGVGSIGVVTSHVNVSSALDKAGYKVTFIFAGKHKVDGNSYEPLPDAVKARIQERIDELYGIFVGTVAQNRALDETAVRATEALTFTASQATSNGLADSIGTLDDALAAFAADLSNPQGDEEMSDKDNSAGSNQAAIDAAVATATANHEAALATALATARTEATTAERTRVAAILGSDEAKGRDGLANHLAFKTDMSVEDAKAALAESPKAEAEGAETPFNKEMSKDNPDVGAGEGDDDKASSNPVELARAAGVRGVRPAATA